MRWLLAKDVRILARSRLLLVVLVVYPAAIALLIGFAISRTPSRPRVAIVDETPPGATVAIGSKVVSVHRYAEQLFSQVQAVDVRTRAQALAKVNAAEVLAAVVIPPDIVAKATSGTTQGRLEVVYNGNALEQSLVQAQLSSALAQANLGFSQQIQQAASSAISQLLHGGNASELGAPGYLIGLDQIPPLLARVISHQPRGPDRAALERVAAFADFAATNLNVSRSVLASVGQPVSVSTRLLHGRRTPLDTFAVVVAVSISEMFVCLLLAAGGLALEREEHTLARLVRGLVARETVLAEKAFVAAGCAFAVAFALLAGVGAFVALDWARVWLWLIALAASSLAFGALGVAIGALAREVRASSLLAFLLSLPLAFLALVPSGAVASGLSDVISAISYVFPFKSALQALDAAVNRSAPAIGGSLVHLAVLVLAFGALARVSLRSAD
ncbi:MAG TPA: ABC transporter permease [Solirubrobacteraceae bacterium]|nr:ABC transporter permease [Solirubrobacteraceae bacterium]